MKRSYALETLSWEHHNGLVLVFRLEQGMQFDASVEEIKRYLLHVWQTALLIHIDLEEKYLMVPEYLRDLKDYLQQMQGDHQIFAEMMKKLNKMKSEQEIRNLIQQFSEKLKTHIRFEERELFPAFEKMLTRVEAKQLGGKLHEVHKPIDLSWPNEFWKRKNGSEQ
ncbi:Hemerythrin HHE cation binding domain protein [Caldithrix abyssi DSM 13497]|uniref:Hemerythrin HHE cation binding domain protein n=1 Tax=Caldithrix abyssi DSM 13497 TaxID=880073 RepID=H1XVL3_CALAY|nr:hemerythrin domain-containing protein [Caldithrix abyssi]APF18955.1 Hemerythrin HHE cation binding domain-containing protein [Caldithrix abyssi DSM 13497]EHO42913.1 Hemerythrin HHE cation binding domain protein [Caldithrix abyssi DSM 13497]